jgi:hypothetical protein
VKVLMVPAQTTRTVRHLPEDSQALPAQRVSRSALEVVAVDVGLALGEAET